jgi:polyphosphate kinase
MRQQILELIRTEARNARKSVPSGIIMKMNSLEDKEIIDELYKASKAGVAIKLIVRGICCLRPQRKDLSENITVISIVGEFLEHTRLLYFHNHGEPKVYGGSADMMVRSFDRRIEALFLIADENLKKEAMKILQYNLMDNQNTYLMREDGAYIKKREPEEKAFNIHREFYQMQLAPDEVIQLF